MTEFHQFSVPLKITATMDGHVVFDRTLSQGPIVFGRTTKNDVTLEFDFVSRKHCQIYEENGKFFLEDLKSSNGIRVAEHKVTKIEVTDIFEFQIATLTVHIEKVLVGAVTLTSPTNSTENEETAIGGKNLLPTVSAAASEFAYPSPLKAPSPVPTAPSGIQPPYPNYQGVTNRPPETGAQKVQRKKSNHYHPILDVDFTNDLLGVHKELKKPGARKVEAIVTWHDRFYDVQEFGLNDRIIAGYGQVCTLPLPVQHNWELARVKSDGTHCFIPANRDVTVLRQGKRLALGDLLASHELKQKTIGYTLKLSPDDVAYVDLGSDIKVTLRYVPQARALTTTKLTEPEQSLKQAIVGSGLFHFIFAFIMILAAPKDENVPKLKNVPLRYARLLVEKPKPKPTPTPKPPEKKVVEKKPEPRKQEVVKSKPKVMKTPKVLAKVNKYPMEVKHPMPKAPPPVKVEALGALGALGPISKNAPQNVVTNININPNAGGLPQKLNTGGIAGALPSTNGTLIAGGSASRVRTKGMGYGTGTGYGMQGLKGTAGSRGVAGAIVGMPKLASLAKEEGLSRAQVMAVVQKYLGEVQHCYEKNLLANPSLSGRMEFEWDISASGQVTAVRVKRSTVNSGDGLGECVKGVFASMQFPHSKNGATTTPNIGFPFGRL